MRRAVSLIFTIYCSLFSLNLYGQQVVRTVNDSDLQNGSYTWHQDTIYLLDGIVYLETGGQLSIEPGTTIMGKQAPSNGDITSALVITQNATIDAVGSPLKPILFTAENDDLNSTSDLGQDDRGYWGGLVILGSGPIAAPSNAWFLPELPVSINNRFGGSNTTDNSGRLQYVSIRHAGAAGFAGLTLGGVGEATTLNHLEVFASGGDGLRLLGSDAAIKYVAVSFCSGDQYLWDYGWQGKGIYWLSIQDGPSGYGLHAKGGSGEPEALSKPVVYNVTLLGPGVEALQGPEVAVFFESSSGGTLANSIITNFPGKAIEVEDLPGTADAYQGLADGRIKLLNNIWGAFGGGSVFETGSEGIIQVSMNSDNPSGNLVIQQLRERGNHIMDNIFHESPFAPAEKINLLKNCYTFPQSAEYPDDEFFHKFISSRFSSITTQGALPSVTAADWWIGFWSTLEQFELIDGNCTLGFNGLIEAFSTQDTIALQCEELDQLIENLRASGGEDLFYYCPLGCYGDFPFELGIRAARRKRKKKRANVDKDGKLDGPYCYVEEWEWKQYIYDNETLAILDTLTIRRYFGVYDNTPPELSLGAPTEDGAVFSLIAEDCDSIFSISYTIDTLLVGEDPPYLHQWTAVDFCGNESSLDVIQYPGNSTIWYKDGDGDGYGDPSEAVEWTLQPPGFVDNHQDCNDENPGSYQGNSENPLNAFDDDCDGEGEIDICEGAVLVPADSVYREFSFLGGKLSRALPFSCDDADLIHKDIWLKSVVPPSGNLLISFIHSGEFGTPQLEFYSGDCTSLTSIGCTGYTGGLSSGLSYRLTGLIPGQLLYIRAGLIFSDLYFNIQLSEINLAENNSCEEAVPLATTTDHNFTYFLPGSYSTISKRPAIPTSCEEGLANVWSPSTLGDRWFTTVMPESEQLLIDIPNYHAVYEGTCEDLVLISCGYDETWVDQIPAGSPLTIRVFNTGGSLNISLLEIPEPRYSNSDCIDAQVLPVYSEPRLQWMSANFAVESSYQGEDPCGYLSNNRNIWYKTTIPASGNLIIEINNYNWDVMQVYEGDCDELTLISCGSPTGNGLRTNLYYRTPGKTIWIRLLGLKFLSHFALNLYEPSPAMDNCADARPLPVDGVCKSFQVTMAYASLTSGLSEDRCEGGFPGIVTSDQWYRTRVPGSGNINIQLGGSSRNLHLGIYRGSCESSQFLGCDGKTLSGLTPGETLYLRIFHDDGTSISSTAEFELCLSDPLIEDHGYKDGLVAHYSFCGCTAEDNREYNGSDGLLAGVPSCVQGPRGEALSLNPDGNALNCGQDSGQFLQLPALDPIWQAGFTFSCWARFDGRGESERLFEFSNGSGVSGGMPIWFGRAGTDNHLVLESWTSMDPSINTQAGHLLAPDAIEPGVWHFLAASISGDTMRIYKNGDLIAQQQGTGLANVYREFNYLGRSYDCETTALFQGMLDEVRLFNRPLSAQEIALIYNQTPILAAEDHYQICEGEVIQLEANDAEAARWSPRYALSNYLSTATYSWPQQSTTYTIAVNLANNCVEEDSIKVSVLPRDIVRNSQIICADEESTGNGGAIYQQEYFQNQSGCDSIQILKIISIPVPDLQIEISEEQAYLHIAGGASGYQVVWSNGASGLASGVLEPGVHFVMVTDQNGCTTKQSFEVEASTVSSTETLQSLQSLRIYPNPSSGIFHLEGVFSSLQEGTIAVITSFGSLIYADNFKGQQAKKTMDLSHLSRGVYWLRLHTKEGILFRKLIID